MMRLNLKKTTTAPLTAKSCQVHPKPKGRRVDSSPVAAEALLTEDELGDQQATDTIVWRYHPRPRSLPKPAADISTKISTGPSSTVHQRSCPVRDDSSSTINSSSCRCPSPPIHLPGLRQEEDASRAGGTEPLEIDMARDSSRQSSPTATAPQTPSSPTATRRNKPRRRRISQLTFLRAAAATCVSMISPLRVQALYSTSLTFDPPVVGYASEITYSFTPEYDISAGKFIRLYLGGFTSGERNGTKGNDVGFNNEFDEGNDAIVWPSDTFRGWWFEGSPQEEYEDGIFNIYCLTTLTSGTNYTAVIDRSSSLKSNCGHPANYTGFFAWVEDVDGYHEFGRTDYLVEDLQEIPMDCYTAPATLTYDPPLPGVKTHVTVGFQPARDLVPGDNVTINLKASTGSHAAGGAGKTVAEKYQKKILHGTGFTSGEGDGTPGNDFEMGELTLGGVNSSWIAGWDEGNFEPDKPGYNNSTLLLRSLTAVGAGEMVEVTVYRSNGLRAQCGIGENASASTITVESASNPPWNSSDVFTYSQTVGSGCRGLNYCSGQGECDYCLQKCNCIDGYGSSTDIVDRDIARDCSGRVCPYGISWAPVLDRNPRPDPDASHTVAECSSMGTCVRSMGACKCEEGFEGRACERYACPNRCSGHGQCRSMREIGFMSTATPLTNATSGATSTTTAQNDAESSTVSYGWSSASGSATWDSHSAYGCVCDSSWEVGLRAGETQEAEYFGPDCSLLHCPTGNDPETVEDETDCSNKAAAGGEGVGEEGNRCHVDCSNRGLCDYSSGNCNCFDGYHGQACDMKQIDGYGFNTNGT